MGLGTVPSSSTKSAHLPGVINPIWSFRSVMAAPACVSACVQRLLEAQVLLGPPGLAFEEAKRAGAKDGVGDLHQRAQRRSAVVRTEDQGHAGAQDRLPKTGPGLETGGPMRCNR